MRTARFRDPAGYERTGEWTDDGIEAAGRTFDPDAVELLAPVEPSKIVCVGLNYVDHIEEGGNDIPDRPSLFLKPPNAVAADGDTITLPEPDVDPEDTPEASGEIALGEGRIDYEAEVGVVIGEQCRNVAAEDAEAVIGGYTCLCDVSNRDDQKTELNWVRGKAFDGSAPMGPVVADPEHVPEDPRVRLWQNGELRQDSAGDEFVFSPAEVIEAVTAFVTLEPGDVLSMGTTYGVGPMSDGDEIELEVEGVGTLSFDVEA
ncbi:MAG: fumarylacetoacetate hydrolase family protein [Halobacteriaceae archaeon]